MNNCKAKEVLKCVTEKKWHKKKKMSKMHLIFTSELT